jgi:hypothetical protein
MRHAPARGSAAKVQREVLSRGNALHSLRSGDRVHVPVGGGLQRVDQAERFHLLEHAQLYLDLDDRLYLRGQKRRARLEEIKRFSAIRTLPDAHQPAIRDQSPADCRSCAFGFAHVRRKMFRLFSLLLRSLLIASAIEMTIE